MGWAQAESRINRFGPHHRWWALSTRLARQPSNDSSAQKCDGERWWFPGSVIGSQDGKGDRMAAMFRRSCRHLLAAGLALLTTLPFVGSDRTFARGGGGGFGGGFGRAGGDGGAFHFGDAGYDGRGSADGWVRGYQGYHPHYGPASRPLWDGGVKDGNFDNNTFQKTVNVNNNFYNRNGNGWNANWANGGYWNNRPWNAGWYAWTPATWGWWGWNTAGWGLTGLATELTLTTLVNDAASRQQTVILVPGSTYQLNYGSVEAVGLYGVSFAYTLGQGDPLMGAANCQAGLLNGQVPATAPQAQLLNAVCQVAYGGGS